MSSKHRHGGDVAVRATGLGKRYRVGDLSFDYMGMHHLIGRVLGAPFARIGNGIRGGQSPSVLERVPRHDVWALREVSFEVQRGEVVGLLGPNGAGKSVLLKILSRVTKPTEGRATIIGRVGSLLEAGAGFHPELTGRDNVFLTGAILGMTRPEIAEKFGDIVEFAGTGEYLDTPVKRYSSGMSARLAMAVAMHLRSDVLIVDEVLSTGDETFRRRAIEKLRVLASAGRAIIFVSHDLELVRQICDRALLLRRGRLVMGDRADAVVAHILAEAEQT